jgi:biopolymer transport protein ExbD
MRRHHYRRRTKPSHELDMTTFLNLMVVLVPFLLITAVFSRITIVELTLPSAAGGPAAMDSIFRVEVIVREEGIELSNGRVVIAALPKADGRYDLPRLSQYLMSLKQQFPEHDDASVLLEPDIAYDYLIQVMDTVRSAQVIDEETDEPMQVALFTAISIGDAP